jgi:nucleotide-binding universal stress UspA family protein
LRIHRALWQEAFMFTSIVVPVDLSEIEISKLALDRASTLASVSNASLHLVYVRSILPITFMEYVPPSFDEEQQADCEKRMKDLVASLSITDKSKVTTAVRMGSVYNEVLAEAEEKKADLIVIGSHRPAMATYLLGSNATTIVRHAPCSVLVVRPLA